MSDFLFEGDPGVCRCPSGMRLLVMVLASGRLSSGSTTHILKINFYPEVARAAKFVVAVIEKAFFLIRN